jgi:hypothetical protein
VIQWSWASKTFERLGNGKVPNVSLSLEPGTHMIGYQEAMYLSSFFSRLVPPAPADVQLASLTEQLEARKRKNGAAGRGKRRRRDEDAEEADDDDEDDEEENFKEAIRQSMMNSAPDAEEQQTKVRQFIDMGFEEEKVKGILAACDWDYETTLTTLLSS